MQATRGSSMWRKAVVIPAGRVLPCLHAQTWKSMPLQAWIQTMLLTANLFPLTCFGIAAVLNTIAIGCGFGHMCAMNRMCNPAAVH